MSDTWSSFTPEEQDSENTMGASSVQPADESVPSEPTPAEPMQPPMNGWSSDGSYRYVPPRSDETDTAKTEQPPAAAVPPVNNTTPFGTAQTPPTGGTPYTPPVTSPVTPPAGQPYTWAPVQPQPPRPPRKKGNGWIIAIAIIGAIGVLAAVVCLGLAAASFQAAPDSGNSNSTVSETDANENRPTLEISNWKDDDGGLSTREVVNRNLDSTVVITLYSQSSNFAFGESNLSEVGAASGIIMSADGYIITNRHCVTNEDTGRNYDRIDVITHDGKVYESAKVIGADESTDLAVIKIEATGLSVAKFGDSSLLAVGDRVVALGNAAGLSWTATQGIVSALARDVYDDTGYALKCLQVDAAINPGNSGGPLLNNQGLVVGINSSKIAASGYEGLGFSIPINEAKTIIDSLMKYGYVKGRVALGINGRNVSSGMYNGFMIATINKGSCLEGTQAAVGDLIVGVDNKTVKNYSELRSELAKHKVGDQVTLSLLRSDGRTGRVTSLTVTVTLKEQQAG